jgi:hypothetical protein
MAGHKDEVFQVSLTEIAFTLILLLVLLLGMKLVNSHREVEQQRETIAEQHEQINSILKELKQYGGICSVDPEDPIDPMMPCNKCVSVVGRISKSDAAHAIDLGKKLVEQFNAKKPQLSHEEYSALLLKTAAKIAEGEVPVFKSEYSDQIKALKEENLRLKEDSQKLSQQVEQAASAKGQLQACLSSNAYYKRRSGLDYPPCWLTSSNKPAYLFNVTLLNDEQILVERGWSNEFNAKALEMTPVQSILDKLGSPMPLSEFDKVARQIKQIGQNTKPEACRYYIRLKNTIPDRPTADRVRLQIESTFYKYEIQ